MRDCEPQSLGLEYVHPIDSAQTASGTANSAIVRVIFPELGQPRSRKVVSRSNARPTGKYPSWKMGRMLHWESENELNAFRILNCNPDVISFNEQPCEIVYVLDGQTRSHFPDILVETNSRKELWEVKPESKALELDVATRTEFLAEALPAWGYSYRLALASELARQPRQKNAFLLLGLGRRAIADCERESIRRALARQGSLLWSDACRGEYSVRGREILCNLVLSGILAIDMNSPILPATRFVARKGEF